MCDGLAVPGGACVDKSLEDHVKLDRGRVSHLSYDADNKRIAKIAPNGSNWRRTDYFHDGAWRVLEERYAASQASKETVPALVKCQYVWDTRYLDACAVRWRDNNDDGDFLDANEVLYYLHDAHFNVTALVDPAGTVQERYAYEPYGLPKIGDTRWIARSVSSFDNQILFSGYRWDAEDQMYHVRNRYYHPTLGRWVTRDPIGEEGGANVFAYVDNNPSEKIDSFGLCSGSFHVQPPHAEIERASLSGFGGTRVSLYEVECKCRQCWFSSIWYFRCRLSVSYHIEIQEDSSTMWTMDLPVSYSIWPTPGNWFGLSQAQKVAHIEGHEKLHRDRYKAWYNIRKYNLGLAEAWWYTDEGSCEAEATTLVSDTRTQFTQKDNDEINHVGW